ncbi:MAG: DUF6435 family protein [bacterium]|nr:DUF6435 family protein [bacterium]
MFGFLDKDQRNKKKLQKQYERKQQEARDLQRSGDIKGFAALTAEADQIYRQIEDLDRSGRTGA